jgi:hypothetical protein
LKPLLAIVYVQPTLPSIPDNLQSSYPININCQLKSAKLLKEIVKMSSLDDPEAVERIIERLKIEIIAATMENIKWVKAEDDDCESEF